MDRRTKFILLVIGSLILFALVGWFIVWPTLQPLFPSQPAAQPPALPSSLTPPTNQPSATKPVTQTTAPAPAATFDPGAVGTSSDAQTIADLARRAGVLAERVESGSSETGFRNLDDAQLNVSPTLSATFQAMKKALQKAHPASGPSYVTVARRLVERGASDVISGPTFQAIVQMQIQIRDNNVTTSVYREATVTFTQTGDTWIASAYTSKIFTP